MDEDDSDLMGSYVSASIRMRWQSVGAVILSGFAAALEELAGIPEALACVLLADANYARERTAFHEEAALEIETLMQ